jgi:hypothetical protein
MQRWAFDYTDASLRGIISALGFFFWSIHMAGSIKWFVYTDDSGQDYGIKLDESNTEAVNGGIQDFLPGAGLTAGVPRNIKVRRAYYANLDRTRVISCVALTQTIYAGVVAGNVASIPDPISSGETLNLIRLEGERRTLPFGQDTGIDDGDDS